jgi:hypothetical protein
VSAGSGHGPSSHRWRVVFTAFRDVGMTTLALWGVWHQESTGKVNPWLLLTYVVILGLIPASHAVALLRAAPSSPPSPEITSAPDTAQLQR